MIGLLSRTCREGASWTYERIDPQKERTGDFLRFCTVAAMGHGVMLRLYGRHDGQPMMREEEVRRSTAGTRRLTYVAVPHYNGVRGASGARDTLVGQGSARYVDHEENCYSYRGDRRDHPRVRKGY
jgi:hypothetical protein